MPSLVTTPGDRLYDVLQAHGRYVVQAAKDAGVASVFGGDVLIGWPNNEELNAVRNGADPIVAIIPIEPSRNVTKYRPHTIRGSRKLNPQPITVTVVENVLTLGGASAPLVNLHTFVGAPLVDVTYQTQNESLASVATNIATRIRSANIPGVTATASGQSVTVTGPYLRCNVGGTGTELRSVGQTDQRIQMTVWAADDRTRGLVVNAIKTRIGTAEDEAQNIPIGDGTSSWTRAAWGPRWTDETVANGMVKRADVAVDAWYHEVRLVALSQVLGFGITLTTQPGGDHVAAEG